MMEAVLDLWWVFPAAVLFSTVAIGFRCVRRPLLQPLLHAGGRAVPGAGYRCSVPVRVAVATSVFTLAITAIVGAGIHAVAARPAWEVVAWSIPGVLVGSTVGSRTGKYIPSTVMEKVLGGVFAAVGGLILALATFIR